MIFLLMERLTELVFKSSMKTVDEEVAYRNKSIDGEKRTSKLREWQ